MKLKIQKIQAFYASVSHLIDTSHKYLLQPCAQFLDTGTLACCMYLFDHVSAADDNADSQPDGRASKRELVGDLEGQLPGRCQDQGVDAVGVLAQRLRWHYSFGLHVSI